MVVHLVTKTPCICYRYFVIQYEDAETPFYDPENQLPRNVEGRKMRVLHAGCPHHDGFSARTQPSDEAWEKARQITGRSTVQYEELEL